MFIRDCGGQKLMLLAQSPSSKVAVACICQWLQLWRGFGKLDRGYVGTFLG